jgi:hypothetical protein
MSPRGGMPRAKVPEHLPFSRLRRHCTCHAAKLLSAGDYVRLDPLAPSARHDFA